MPLRTNRCCCDVITCGCISCTQLEDLEGKTVTLELSGLEWINGFPCNICDEETACQSLNGVYTLVFGSPSVGEVTCNICTDTDSKDFRCLPDDDPTPIFWMVALSCNQGGVPELSIHFSDAPISGCPPTGTNIAYSTNDCETIEDFLACVEIPGTFAHNICCPEPQTSNFSLQLQGC